MSKLLGNKWTYIFVLALCSASVSLLVYLDDYKIIYTLNLVLFRYYKLCDVLFN